MKLKTLLIVVAVLAVLSGAVALLKRPRHASVPDPRVGQTVLSLGSAAQAARVRITENGQTVELVTTDGKAWHVASYYDLPADFTKLSSFIGNLAAAKIDSFISSNPTTLARLEFNGTRIELLDPAGHPLLDLALGKADGNGSRYIRYGGEEKAYLARVEAFLDSNGHNWADATLLKLKPDDIGRIELTFPAADPVVLTRAKPDAPFAAERAPEGQQIKAATLSNILNNLTTLRFTDTAALDDAKVTAARSDARTVKLTTFDSKTLTYALGRKPEEKKLKPPAPSTATPPAPATPSDKPATLDDLAAKVSSTSAALANGPAKPAEPEYETIPAGPVFVFVTASDPAAAINRYMGKRAFQVAENLFTDLPAAAADLFEPLPVPPPSPTPPSASDAPKP